MMEAMHDTSVVREMNAFLAAELEAGRRPVAIMGDIRKSEGVQRIVK